MIPGYFVQSTLTDTDNLVTYEEGSDVKVTLGNGSKFRCTIAQIDTDVIYFVLEDGEDASEVCFSYDKIDYIEKL